MRLRSIIRVPGRSSNHRFSWHRRRQLLHRLADALDGLYKAERPPSMTLRDRGRVPNNHGLGALAGQRPPPQSPRLRPQQPPKPPANNQRSPNRRTHRHLNRAQDGSRREEQLVSAMPQIFGSDMGCHPLDLPQSDVERDSLLLNAPHSWPLRIHEREVQLPLPDKVWHVARLAPR